MTIFSSKQNLKRSEAALWVILNTCVRQDLTSELTVTYIRVLFSIMRMNMT